MFLDIFILCIFRYFYKYVFHSKNGHSIVSPRSPLKGRSNLLNNFRDVTKISVFQRGIPLWIETRCISHFQKLVQFLLLSREKNCRKKEKWPITTRYVSKSRRHSYKIWNDHQWEAIEIVEFHRLMIKVILYEWYPVMWRTVQVAYVCVSLLSRTCIPHERLGLVFWSWQPEGIVRGGEHPGGESDSSISQTMMFSASLLELVAQCPCNAYF